MTFRVTLNADQIFLSMVKRTIERMKTYDEATLQKYEVEECATCIILCQAALESVVNTIGIEELDATLFEVFDRKSLLDKLHYLFEKQGCAIDWSTKSFQKIKQLNIIRNWLIHFKDGDIGLLSSNSGWLLDKHHKTKKFDLHKALSLSSTTLYYQETRQILHQLTTLFNSLQSESYLTEDFEAYLVG